MIFQSFIWLTVQEVGIEQEIKVFIEIQCDRMAHFDLIVFIGHIFPFILLKV